MVEFCDFEQNLLLLSRLACILFLIIALLSYPTVSGQVNPASNLRLKQISAKADSVKIDSFSLVPRSFMISNISPADYKLDEIRSMLFWIRKPASDSVQVTYRTFPFSFTAGLQRMNYDSVVNNFYVAPFALNNGTSAGNKGMFDFGTLKAEGSFGRQIGFGSNQDAVLNSTLNLQLSGMLGDSIEIQAAITDNNIPIQPDGTTQQLNEFDQVYLGFKKKNWQLSLGDIDIRQNSDYFLSFYKRLQGISFNTTNAVGKNMVSKTLASGSIAKGKFNRQIITPVEGNQGPYRLRGANNEFFFIVLANTERVFIDGELMQRGEYQDYVINYNSAEVIFTPKRMITKDSRLQVEFEYADRNFLNANLYLSQEFDLGSKWKVRLGIFNNSDAKNSQINQDLNNQQKQFLSELGDSVQQAFYPSAILDTLSPGKILYEKLFNGPDSFYQYSTNPALAHYSLSFVDVGPGKGNYLPDFNGANGKVYKYVAPVGSIKQGQYEPVQILITPKTQQIVNLGVEYVFSKTGWIKTEVATSNTDVNTFSSKDNGDDRGWAAKIRMGHEKTFAGNKKLQLTTGADFEYVQQKFKPLERIRNVEFSRDWGLPILATGADERILKASVALKDKKSHLVSYQLINYNRNDHYNGIQHSLIHQFNVKGWQFNDQFVITQFSGLADKGLFLRPVIDFSKQFKKMNNWRMGFRYALEQNTVRNKATDTLLPASSAFSFDTYTLYFKSDDLKKNKYGISFFTRSDKYPVQKDFIRGDRSYNLNLQTELLANDKRGFILNTTFRKLEIINPVSPQKADETILGRVQYRMNEWKGLLNGEILYEIGAGQEQRRDFAYLEVPAGTGQFAWVDYNSNGVQELNEFELAVFQDQAKFIRILTPTSEFIKANFITFNYSFTLNPRSVLRSPNLKGFKKLLANTVLLTSLQTSKKSLSSGKFEFNPFKYGFIDTALISSVTAFNNSLSFNRFSPKWGVDLINQRNNSKSLLTYGYETNRVNDWYLKWRKNIGRSFSILLNGKNGNRSLLTPRFANRNYVLSSWYAEPTFIYIYGTKFRVVSSYKWEKKKNKPEYGGEKSVSNSVNLESKYNLVHNSSINAKFIFNNIDYKFPANTTVSYVMLDGLLPGKNFIWSLGFTRRLMNNLDLNIQYDGRKAGIAPVVHTGRASLTALF